MFAAKDVPYPSAIKSLLVTVTIILLSIDQIRKPQYLVYDHIRFSVKVKWLFSCKCWFKVLWAFGRLGSSTGLAPLSFLWVAVSYGCIIIPVYGSWRRQLPDCRLRFADNTARPVWGSWRTSPQARRIQNVSDCPMLRDKLSLSKYRGLSARKSTQGKICFCGMISTKKAHAGEVERGVVTFPLVGFY